VGGEPRTNRLFLETLNRNRVFAPSYEFVTAL